MRRTSSTQALSPTAETPTTAASAFTSKSEHQFHTSPTPPTVVGVEAITDATATVDEARADSIISGNCGDPSEGGLGSSPDQADILQSVDDFALSESLNQGHLLDCSVTDHTEVTGSNRDTDCDAAPTGRVQEDTTCQSSSSSVSDIAMPHCNGDVTQQEEALAAAEWELVGESLEGEAVDVIDSEEYVLL